MMPFILTPVFLIRSWQDMHEVLQQRIDLYVLYIMQELEKSHHNTHWTQFSPAIFPSHKILEGENELFGPWSVISQNPENFSQVICATTILCTFLQLQLCNCRRLDTPRSITFFAQQITYRRCGHVYCKNLPVTLCWKIRHILFRIWEVCFFLK